MVCILIDDVSKYNNTSSSKESNTNFSYNTNTQNNNQQQQQQQQDFNASFSNWASPQTIANAYSRFISNVADNTVTALRTTNNLVFASLDAFKTTVQHAKDTTKQIFDINA